jgi:hypothetical protein
MKRVYADKSLDIRQDAKFIQPKEFDDCGSFDPTSMQRSSTYNSSGYYPANDSSDVEEVPQTDWE